MPRINGFRSGAANSAMWNIWRSAAAAPRRNAGGESVGGAEFRRHLDGYSGWDAGASRTHGDEGIDMSHDDHHDYGPARSHAGSDAARPGGTGQTYGDEGIDMSHDDHHDYGSASSGSNAQTRNATANAATKSGANGAPTGGTGPKGQIVSVGNGTGQYFNVTNNSGKVKYEQFTSTNGIKKTMTLQPGETKTFEAGPNTPGIRIQQVDGPSDNANQVNPGKQGLFEDAIINGVHNSDVSDVDNNTPDQAITVVTGDGKAFGNAFQGSGNGAYLNSNDDAVLKGKNSKLNPMIGANDSTNTINISVDDNTRTFSNGAGVPVGSNAPI